MPGPSGFPRRSRSTTLSAAGAALLAACCWQWPGHAAAPEAPGLDAAVHATWTRLPLRSWAARATALAGRPVIVDRRIDPDTPITLECRGEPLVDVLDRVAASADAAIEELHSTIRIVPKPLRGVYERAELARDKAVARLPGRSRDALNASRGWEWPEAASPSDLVAAAAAESGVTLVGTDAVPHDHFPAATLPPLSLAERLDLLLAHFDLRIDWHASAGTTTGTIVAIDSAPAPPAPTAALPRRGRPKPRESGTPPAGRREVYSLRVEAPLDQVLATLARQFRLELELDAPSLRARGIAPAEIVRADVKDASRDELLDAVVRPLGLAWTIEGGRLRVSAPPTDR